VIFHQLVRGYGRSRYECFRMGQFVSWSEKILAAQNGQYSTKIAKNCGYYFSKIKRYGGKGFRPQSNLFVLATRVQSLAQGMLTSLASTTQRFLKRCSAAQGLQPDAFA
jgi:hypothetical protein